MDQGTNLGGKESAVLQAIKNYGTEEGISRNELKKKFEHISRTELE